MVVEMDYFVGYWEIIILIVIHDKYSKIYIQNFNNLDQKNLDLLTSLKPALWESKKEFEKFLVRILRLFNNYFNL